jgi:hypothetical protein
MSRFAPSAQELRHNAIIADLVVRFSLDFGFASTHKIAQAVNANKGSDNYCDLNEHDVEMILHDRGLHTSKVVQRQIAKEAYKAKQREQKRLESAKEERMYKLPADQDQRIKRLVPDQWDRFFKQTHFRTPGPLQTLPKVDKYVTTMLLNTDDGESVTAVGNGVDNANTQMRALQTVVCMVRETVIPGQFKPGALVFGKPVSIKIPGSVLPSVHSKRHGHNGHGQLPFRKCTLQLPHSASKGVCDLLVLQTNDLVPDRLTRWTAIGDPDNRDVVKGNKTVMISVHRSGSYCLAQRSGSTKFLAVSAYCSSLGANKRGVPMDCTIAITNDVPTCADALDKVATMHFNKGGYWKGFTHLGLLRAVPWLASNAESEMLVWAPQHYTTSKRFAAEQNDHEKGGGGSSRGNALVSGKKKRRRANKFLEGTKVLVRSKHKNDFQLMMGEVKCAHWDHRGGYTVRYDYPEQSVQSSLGEFEERVAEGRLLNASAMLANMAECARLKPGRDNAGGGVDASGGQGDAVTGVARMKVTAPDDCTLIRGDANGMRGGGEGMRSAGDGNDDDDDDEMKSSTSTSSSGSCGRQRRVGKTYLHPDHHECYLETGLVVHTRTREKTSTGGGTDGGDGEEEGGKRTSRKSGKNKELVRKDGTTWVKHWYELRIKMPVSFGRAERQIVKKQEEEETTLAQQELEKQKRLEEAIEGAPVKKRQPHRISKKKKITFAGLMEEYAVDSKDSVKLPLDPSTRVTAKLLDEIHFSGDKGVNYDKMGTFDDLTDEVETTIEMNKRKTFSKKAPPTTPMPSANFSMDSISQRKYKAPPGVMPIWALKKRHRHGVPLH